VIGEEAEILIMIKIMEVVVGHLVDIAMEKKALMK